MTGLKAGDVIVTDVTDDVVEGAVVQTHQSKSAEQPVPPKQNKPLGGSTQYSNEGITDQNLQGQQTQQNQKSTGKSQGKNSSSESKP